MGLKTGSWFLGQVVGKMQWSVNEQCVQYDDYDTFRPFIEQGKLVFHVGYSYSARDVSAKDVSDTCGSAQASGFSTVLKDVDLDDWVIECPQSS